VRAYRVRVETRDCRTSLREWLLAQCCLATTVYDRVVRAFVAVL
jgi:hypothetical protein